MLATVFAPLSFNGAVSGVRQSALRSSNVLMQARRPGQPRPNSGCAAIDA